MLDVPCGRALFQHVRRKGVAQPVRRNLVRVSGLLGGLPHPGIHVALIESMVSPFLTRVRELIRPGIRELDQPAKRLDTRLRCVGRFGIHPAATACLSGRCASPFFSDDARMAG